MRGKVEDWATESLLAAMEAYKVPETGSGSSLVRSYQTPI
jgi:hypothetical protein